MAIKLLLSFFIFLQITLSASVYEKNCVVCHKKLPVSIDKYFYRYLLKYSSETNVKEAMLVYLKQPSSEQTIMPEAFINRFGIKKKTKLNDSELKDALNEYWEIYKVFGKLK